MSRNSGSKLKKLVKFNQQNNSSKQTNGTKMYSQFSEIDHNTKSQFSRRKIFNIQNCKFMSMKNINIQGTNQASFAFQPVKKIERHISKMEDILAKNQRAYTRRIKNLGKRYNKQCEKQIQLAEQAMELRYQLKKNLKALAQLKLLLGKENLESTPHQKTKSRSNRDRFRRLHSPHKINHQYFKY